MRTMFTFDDCAEIPSFYAQEIARVGMVPTEGIDPIGYQIMMGGQRFVCGPEVTLAEFRSAVEAAGMDWEESDFHNLPANVKFQRVSTD